LRDGGSNPADNFCADLNVYRPQERLWKPPPRKAAKTLGVMQARQPKIFENLHEIVFDVQVHTNFTLLSIKKNTHAFLLPKVCVKSENLTTEKPP
jgi:hypothetical protein